MSALTPLYTGVYNTLGAGTALTALLGGTAIYKSQAPDGTPLPYVVYSLQAGGPENITKKTIENDLLFVRAYATNDAAARAIDDQVDILLRNKSITVTGYNNFCTFRTGDIDLPSMDTNGVITACVGGLYRFRLSKA
jgi:hypothetical protein